MTGVFVANFYSFASNNTFLYTPEHWKRQKGFLYLEGIDI